jgi:hypothetical protein
MPTYGNRAKVNTSTVGTGTITLGSAVDGFQTFTAAGISDLDLVRYVLEDGNSWEIGVGIYNAGTITRGPTESSNAGSAINLSGSAVIYNTVAAEDVLTTDDEAVLLAESRKALAFSLVFR